MQDKAKATTHRPSPELLTFSPPASTPHQPVVGGKLTMLPLASVTGVVSHQFHFREEGGPSHLLPGRPLDQAFPINVPTGAGFIVTLSGFSGAFVTNDPPNQLTERPLGQFEVFVGIDKDRKNLTCHVRLTDSNSDDPIEIFVNAVVLFFN